MAKLRVEGYSVYLDDADERAKFDFAFAVGTAIMADELNPYAAPWEKHLPEDPPYISYHGGMSNVFRSIVKRISSMTGIPVVQKETKETIYLVMRDDGNGNGRYWRIQGDDALGWLLSKMLPQSSRVFVYRRETDGALTNVSRNIRIEGGHIVIAIPKQETAEKKTCRGTRR